MPRGAVVIRYQGRRGVVWRIQYRDAAGRYVKETLGREPGWSRDRAERELGKRLAAVEDGYRRPDKLTFAAFAERFQNEYLPGRNLKPTTLENYRYILDGHLLLHFGPFMLSDLEAQPELIDSYIAQNAHQGLSPKTIHNHLVLLNMMLRRAVVWRLIRSNPVASIDRPRLSPPEMNVLTEVEIARLTTAYDQLRHDATDEARHWWQLAKVLVLVALGTGLRRGELLGLRWSAVDLLDGKIEVREALVRGKRSTPKSRASRRVLELGPRTRHVLEQHWQQSRRRGDDDLVFCHPTLERLLTRASSRAVTSNRHSNRQASPNRFAHSTTCATPRSPTPPQPATRKSTCRPVPATPRARSPSATCTPPKCSSPAPPHAASSACLGRNNGARGAADELPRTSTWRYHHVAARTLAKGS